MEKNILSVFIISKAPNANNLNIKLMSNYSKLNAFKVINSNAILR